MSTQIRRALGIAGILGVCLLGRHILSGQEAVPPPPQGVEVMARGPVHEAFATPTAETRPTHTIPRKPPLPIEEMPPTEKPEGEVVWIGGYYAFDDDRNDFLWVSGCWRTQPPGRDWVPGYWREQGEQWQWVAGFWTEPAPQQAAAKEIVYQPEPPAPPAMAPPGPPPTADTFYVPGHWVWNGGRYAWRPGYWARVQPGFVWVSSHYRWTPYGYVYIAGYWDLAVARRGMLYAPVFVDPVVVGPRFVYTPAYAVSDAVVLDTLFVRPSCCHYYFGDYYGPRYRDLGYESCVVYSRTHYDSLVVYRSWEYRDNPRWLDVQINLSSDRYYGRAPVPPRSLTQINNTTIINNYNTTVLAPTSQAAKDRGLRTVAVPPAARQQAALHARTVQQTAIAQRRQAETPVAGRPLTAPRTASLQVPSSRPIGAPPMKAAGTPHPNPGIHPNPHPPGMPPTPKAGPPGVAPRPPGMAPLPKTGPPGSRPPYAPLGARPPAPAPRPAPIVAPRPQPRPAPPHPSGKKPPDDKNHN